jgi:hypothetical protein
MTKEESRRRLDQSRRRRFRRRIDDFNDESKAENGLAKESEIVGLVTSCDKRSDEEKNRLIDIDKRSNFIV